MLIFLKYYNTDTNASQSKSLCSLIGKQQEKVACTYQYLTMLPQFPSLELISRTWLHFVWLSLKKKIKIGKNDE